MGTTVLKKKKTQHMFSFLIIALEKYTYKSLKNHLVKEGMSRET